MRLRRRIKRRKRRLLLWLRYRKRWILVWLCVCLLFAGLSVFVTRFYLSLSEYGDFYKPKDLERNLLKELLKEKKRD